MAIHRFQDEWLVKAALKIPGVTSEILENLRKTKAPCLASLLLEKRLAPETELYRVVAQVYHISRADIEPSSIEEMAPSMVPDKVCRQRKLLPLRLRHNRLELAMANPLDLEALQDVQALSGHKTTPFYCAPPDLEALLEKQFSSDACVSKLLEQIGSDAQVEFLDSGKDSQDFREAVEPISAPVVQLVNGLLSQAVLKLASDIHVEQGETTTEVRYRIDGILQTVLTLPRSVGKGPLVSRIKIMGNLDVSNHRQPQDGRAKIRVGGREVGLRISTLPTAHGEKVVIRILDQRSAERPLHIMGFQPAHLARLENLLQAEQGMIIVTGPTGSGKTTTLYAMLNKIKSDATNIVTIEDPIEYRLPGINQVQVNEKQGLTFAGSLRSVLRQDPDVILVGEIRDMETASVAFQAAMTGHLVFSTLHTNDTVSSIARLADMGVERYKIAPGLLAITSQRLVRRLCGACRQPVPPSQAVQEIVVLLQRSGFSGAYFRAAGCEACELSGYKSRLCLLELFETNREMRERIAAGDDEGLLRQKALATGALETIQHDALWHLSQGDTGLEEVLPHLLLDMGKAEPARPIPMIKEPLPSVSVIVESAPPVSVIAEPPPPAPEIKEPGPPVPVIEEMILVSARPAGSSRRALIADDDPTVRLIMGELLTHLNFDVDEVADGAEAISRLGNGPPDLLIVDLHMPNMNGHGVIRHVRQTLGLLEMPIIMLTANADDVSHEEAINLGADDYLIKPLKPSLAQARINAVLRRK